MDGTRSAVGSAARVRCALLPLILFCVGADSLSIDAVGQLLQQHRAKNVLVLAGAGISVAAGIPDFRSPGTGLYDNLNEYGLPYAEAIFDLCYFQSNPTPFYRLCSELWPGNYAPTAAHHFIKMLHDEGLLLRCYTQNIDSLESAAGVPSDRLIAAHGNFDSAHTLDGAAVPIDEVRAAALDGGPQAWSALNARHGGLVKPDIVFFGENLPPRFFSLLKDDFPRCDLLVVMGTSLTIQPVMRGHDSARQRLPLLASQPAPSLLPSRPSCLAHALGMSTRAAVLTSRLLPVRLAHRTSGARLPEAAHQSRKGGRASRTVA